MAWILKKKRIGDVKAGELAVDIDGRVTRVLGSTKEETPDQLFELMLDDGTGRKQRIRTDAGHVWPLDVQAWGSLPPDWDGEPEATTGSIARWCAMGWQPVLSPMIAEGRHISWTVRSCILLSDSIANNTKVKCIKVDSPLHTFMLATDGSPETIPVGVEQGPDDAEPSDTTVNTSVDIENNPPSTVHSSDDKNTSDANDGIITGEAREDSVDADSGKNDVDLDYLERNGVSMIDRDTFDKLVSMSVPTHNCGGPLSLDTVLPLYDGGYTTMGDVKVGDVLIAPDGGPTEVIGTSPVMDAEEAWELEVEEYDGDDVPDWTVADLEKAEAEYESQFKD